MIDFPLPSQDHLATLFRDLLDVPSESHWPIILGVALEGSSFSDAAQSIRRAKRMSVLGSGNVDQYLSQIVRDAAVNLSRDGKQELALRLTQSGLSQRQASEITGVSRDTIRKHEQRIEG